LEIHKDRRIRRQLIHVQRQRLGDKAAEAILRYAAAHRQSGRQVNSIWDAVVVVVKVKDVGGLVSIGVFTAWAVGALQPV
jgi:hypothetical protein